MILGIIGIKLSRRANFSGNRCLWIIIAQNTDFNLPGIQAKVIQIEATLFSKQGISLKIDSPVVMLSPKPASSSKKEAQQEPSQPWSFLKRIGSAEIENGRIELQYGQAELTASGSLKHKRRYLQSLKSKIGSKFNVSVAEVGSHDLWQKIDLAMVMVSTDSVHIDQVFAEIMKLISRQADLDILDQSRELW